MNTAVNSLRAEQALREPHHVPYRATLLHRPRVVADVFPHDANSALDLGFTHEALNPDSLILGKPISDFFLATAMPNPDPAHSNHSAPPTAGSGLHGTSGDSISAPISLGGVCGGRVGREEAKGRRAPGRA